VRRGVKGCTPAGRMSGRVPPGGEPARGGGGKPPPTQNPGRRERRGRPRGSAQTGPSARRVDACLSRCAARALFAATVALPLLASNVAAAPRAVVLRSEEHTSELQSLTNLVCRLLLEKKKSYYSHLLCNRSS